MASLLVRLALVTLLVGTLKVRYVYLSWTPSRSAAPGLTYTIYRLVSSTPCPRAGHPFYQVLKAGLYYQAKNYFDHAVLSGYSYCYYIVAVKNGHQSVPAGPVGARVP